MDGSCLGRIHTHAPRPRFRGLGTFEQVARELTGWTEPGTIRMQGRGWGELQLVLVPHASS